MSLALDKKVAKATNHLNVVFVTILHPGKILGINICYQQVSKKCVTKVLAVSKKVAEMFRF